MHMHKVLQWRQTTVRNGFSTLEIPLHAPTQGWGKNAVTALQKKCGKNAGKCGKKCDKKVVSVCVSYLVGFGLYV